MKRKVLLSVSVFALMALLCGSAFAHTPLFSCWDNGDGTFSCEAGFSDGSSDANMPVFMLDDKGEKIAEEKIDKGGEVSFKRPEGAFTVKFDGGPGHDLVIKGEDIK